jgi:hypothetical protein
LTVEWALVLLDQVATIHHDRPARHIACRLGGEEGDDLGDLLWATGPPHRRVRACDQFLRE